MLFNWNRNAIKAIAKVMQQCDLLSGISEVERIVSINGKIMGDYFMHWGWCERREHDKRSACGGWREGSGRLTGYKVCRLRVALVPNLKRARACAWQQFLSSQY